MIADARCPETIYKYRRYAELSVWYDIIHTYIALSSHMFTSEIINADGRQLFVKPECVDYVVGHDKLPHMKFTIAIVTIYLT